MPIYLGGRFVLRVPLLIPGNHKESKREAPAREGIACKPICMS
jgi:hypothetical protein